MPDPTGLTPTQHARYRTLIDALGDVPATEEERRTLAWLTGWEADTVTHLAALLAKARRGGLDAPRADIPDGTTIGKLATAYEWHVGALHGHTAKREALTAAQHHRSLRAALALGAKLRDRLAAERWPLIVDALAAGDSPDQVAASASLEPCELGAGVAAWADGLVESGEFTPAQRDRALTKARFAQHPDGTWSL